MKTIRARFAVAACALAAALPVASETGDPDWPCIQRKTGPMSAAVLWSGPLPEAPATGAAADLAAALALRRVSLEEAAARVAGFAGANRPDAATLGAIFRGAFDRIDRDRTRLIGGISRYAHAQAALAGRIDAAHAEFARIEAEKEPDFDRLDALEEQIDWDERIYRDRERSLTYVCETPVLLEKRAYAVAQMLMEYLPE